MPLGVPRPMSFELDIIADTVYFTDPGAHYQFMTSVLNYAVADEKIAEETHLKPLVQNLTTALTKEDKDLKISQKGYPVIG